MQPLHWSRIFARHWLGNGHEILRSSASFYARQRVIHGATLEKKCAGARRTGKPHAVCDVARAGNVTMGKRCTRLTSESVGLEILSLQGARQCSALPGYGPVNTCSRSRILV